MAKLALKNCASNCSWQNRTFRARSQSARRLSAAVFFRIIWRKLLQTRMNHPQENESVVAHWLSVAIAGLVILCAIQLLIILLFGREAAGQAGDAFNILGTFVGMAGTAVVAGTLYLQVQQNQKHERDSIEQRAIQLQIVKAQERQATTLALTTALNYHDAELHQLYDLRQQVGDSTGRAVLLAHAKPELRSKIANLQTLIPTHEKAKQDALIRLEELLKPSGG